jgi:hypothetical protein
MKQTDKNCAGCGTKLTFFTKPNFGGGKLSDGARVCRKCFTQITKYDISFGMNSKRRYNTEKIQNILNGTITEVTIDTNVKTSNFNSNEIQNRGIQVLESINVIDNTKNSDTIKSRFEFLGKLYPDFIIAATEKRYISDIQVAIDEYKSRYYDKILNDYEVELLVKPSLEKLSIFYAESLMKCFDRFLKEQFEQIGNLKRQNAIEKRLEKIIDVANEIASEITSHGNSSVNFEEYIEQIEKIREETYNKRHNNAG